MAQITNSTRTCPRPYRSRKGDYWVQTFTASTAISTAVIRYGDVVQFDVNTADAGYKIVKASTMANQPNVISTALLGIAVSNSTGDGSTSTEPIQVCVAEPMTEFLFPTKLAGADHTSTLVNKRKAIGYDSTLGMFYMDNANSTAGDATLVVTDIVDPGTSNGLVVAKFLSTNTARFVSAAF